MMNVHGDSEQSVSQELRQNAEPDIADPSARVSIYMRILTNSTKYMFKKQ